MKKRLLVGLLSLVFVLTACGGSTSTASTASSEASSTDSSVSSEVTSSSSIATSSDAAISSAASTASTASTGSKASTATTSKTSTATTSKASTTSTTVKVSIPSKTSTTTATGGKDISVTTSGVSGSYKIGTNPTCGLPVAATIVREMFYGDASFNQDDKDKWMQTLSARYGVKLTEECFTKADVGTIYNARLAAGTLLGVVTTYSKDQWVGWMADGTILPLDEYLKDNATWKTIPQAAKNSFQMNGQTWGIPTSLTGVGTGNGASWTRALRLDWVKACGIAAPGTTITTDQYYSMLQSFATNATKLNSAGVIPVAFRNDCYTYMDIWGAFDARIMNDDNFGYNLEGNYMEDTLLRPQAQNAMAFMRNIYANNLCPKTTFDTGSFADLRAVITGGKVASFVLYHGRYNSGDLVTTPLAAAYYSNITPFSWDKVGDGYTEFKAFEEKTWADVLLTGTRTKNLESYAPSSAGYVLMKGTAQPKETVNFVLDLWYAASDNFIESSKGLLGYNIVKDSDGTLMLKYKDKSQNLYYTSPALIGTLNPTPYPDGNYITYSENAKGPSIKRSQIVTAYILGLDTTYINQGLIFATNTNYFSPETNSLQWQNYKNQSNSYMLACLVDGFTKTSEPISQVVADYKAHMRSINGDLILKQTNDAFGMKNTVQSYN